jgi:ribosomal protein S6--L-glutamate ligase
VLPNWDDFPKPIQSHIREAAEIYYPSRLYEDLFLSIGKAVFPRNYYRFMGNKIRQTELFQFLQISHPRTRIYPGRKHLEVIERDFEYPFVAKDPIGSSQGKGVWLIRDRADLLPYLDRSHPAYVQEYFQLERDLRVVLVAGWVVHAYWRIAGPGEFRNNVSRGAAVSFEEIPGSALEFAMDVAERCRFDDVGLDICFYNQRYYVLEANMVYGLEGFRALGLDLYEMLADLDRGRRIGGRGKSEYRISSKK